MPNNKLVVVVFVVAVVSEGHASMQSPSARARAELNEQMFLEVLPDADRFERAGGLYAHVRGYATSASGDDELVGLAFLTIDVGTPSRGYNGVIPILVGMDTHGRIAGVKMLRHLEPYGYRSINRPEYRAQFKGKSIFDRFEVGDDIDGYSGATITTAAATKSIRYASRRIAREYLVEK